MFSGKICRKLLKSVFWEKSVIVGPLIETLQEQISYQRKDKIWTFLSKVGQNSDSQTRNHTSLQKHAHTSMLALHCSDNSQYLINTTQSCRKFGHFPFRESICTLINLAILYAMLFGLFSVDISSSFIIR